MKVAKIILAIIAVVLVVGSILFCLPKSADTVLGTKEITTFSCIVTEMVFDEETHTIRHEAWKASYETNSDETIEKLAGVLSSSRYRPMMRTFLRPSKFEIDGDYAVDLILVLSDGSTHIFDFMGDDIILSRTSPISLLMRPTDREVCTRLAEYIKEIGQQS